MKTYTLTLRPTPGDIPPEIRLRRLLKIALRSCGLRCVNVSEQANASDAQERGGVEGTDDTTSVPIVAGRAAGAGRKSR